MFFFIASFLTILAMPQVKGQCQNPGNAKCFSSTTPIGPVGGACCAGSICQPYLPEGTSLTVPVDWYCQYTAQIALNRPCGNKEGNCATGLNCIDGLCSDQSTTTASPTTTAAPTSTSGPTTTASPTSTGAQTTSATATSSATTVVTATTAEVCDKNAGELCLNTQYNIQGTCCSPYTCTFMSGASSLCKGENLALNDTCFDSMFGSVGTCASPLICLNNVCTAKDSTCIQPVNGVCKLGDLNYVVGDCCSGSSCYPVNGSSDYFCYGFNLAAGDNCNPDEHRGYCGTDLFCNNKICSETEATTTAAPTTQVCIGAGLLCGGPGATGADCCVGQCDVFVVDFDPSKGFNCPA